MPKFTPEVVILKKQGRLYLAYTPDGAARRYLSGLQKQLIADAPKAKPVDKTKFHLTVLHLGIFKELLGELQKSNRRLDEAAFAATLGSFIRSSEHGLPLEAEVTVTGLSVYGPDRGVLGLTVRPDRQLSAALQSALKGLKALIMACGLTDPDVFIGKSPNLQHAPKLDLHVSLARGAKSAPTLKIKPAKLKLNLRKIL